MTSRDLSAFFGGGALVYERIPSAKHPDGKTYTVPSPSGRVGLMLNQAAEAGFSIADGNGSTKVRDSLRLDDDDEERDFLQLVMGCRKDCGAEVVTPGESEDDEPTVTYPRCGSAFDQMIDDDVDWMLIQRVGQDAFLCFGINQEFADALNALDARDAEGKAPEPANRAARRAKKPPAKKAARKTAKKPSSARKDGSSSNRASGAASTRTSRARTPGSDAPGPAVPEARTA